MATAARTSASVPSCWRRLDVVRAWLATSGGYDEKSYRRSGDHGRLKRGGPRRRSANHEGAEAQLLCELSGALERKTGGECAESRRTPFFSFERRSENEVAVGPICPARNAASPDPPTA